MPLSHNSLYAYRFKPFVYIQLLKTANDGFSAP